MIDRQSSNNGKVKLSSDEIMSQSVFLILSDKDTFWFLSPKLAWDIGSRKPIETSMTLWGSGQDAMSVMMLPFCSDS